MINMKEYKLKLSGEIDKKFINSIDNLGGKVQELEDHKIVLSFDENKEIKNFKQLYNKIIKNNPDIPIQFKYDINIAAFEAEKKKLEDMELLVHLNEKGLSDELNRLGKQALEIQNRMNSMDNIDSGPYKELEHHLSDIMEQFSQIKIQLHGMNKDSYFNNLSSEIKQIYNIAGKKRIALIDDKKILTQKKLVNDITNIIKTLESNEGIINKRGYGSGNGTGTNVDEKKIQQIEDEINNLKNVLSEIQEKYSSIEIEITKDSIETIKDLNIELDALKESLESIKNNSNIEISIKNLLSDVEQTVSADILSTTPITTWSTYFLEQLEKIRTSFSTLFGKNILSEINKGYSSADLAQLLYGSTTHEIFLEELLDSKKKKPFRKMKDVIRERGFYFNSKNGSMTSPYKFDQPKQISHSLKSESKDPVKSISDNGYDVSWHSHPEFNSVFSTIMRENDKIVGDLFSWYDEYKHGIKTQINSSILDTTVFDAEGFYKEFGKNIDDFKKLSKTKQNELIELKNKKYKNLDGKSPNIFLKDFIEKFGEENDFSNSNLLSKIENVIGSNRETKKGFELIKQYYNSLNDEQSFYKDFLNKAKSANTITSLDTFYEEIFKDVANANKDNKNIGKLNLLINKLSQEATSEVTEQLFGLQNGLLNNGKINDLKAFSFQQLLPQFMNEVFNIPEDEFLKYFHVYTQKEFEELNLFGDNSTKLANFFDSEPLISFSKALEKISIYLENIVSLLKNIDPNIVNNVLSSSINQNSNIEKTTLTDPTIFNTLITKVQDDLCPIINQIGTAFSNEKVAADYAIDLEIKDLDDLYNKIKDVIEIINEKSEAFKKEAGVVRHWVPIENEELLILKKTLGEITYYLKELEGLSKIDLSNLKLPKEPPKIANAATKADNPIDANKQKGREPVKGLKNVYSQEDLDIRTGAILDEISLTESKIKEMGGEVTTINTFFDSEENLVKAMVKATRTLDGKIENASYSIGYSFPKYDKSGNMIQEGGAFTSNINSDDYKTIEKRQEKENKLIARNQVLREEIEIRKELARLDEEALLRQNAQADYYESYYGKGYEEALKKERNIGQQQYKEQELADQIEINKALIEDAEIRKKISDIEEEKIKNEKQYSNEIKLRDQLYDEKLKNETKILQLQLDSNKSHENEIQALIEKNKQLKEEISLHQKNAELINEEAAKQSKIEKKKEIKNKFSSIKDLETNKQNDKNQNELLKINNKYKSIEETFQKIDFSFGPKNKRNLKYIEEVSNEIAVLKEQINSVKENTNNIQLLNENELKNLLETLEKIEQKEKQIKSYKNNVNYQAADEETIYKQITDIDKLLAKNDRMSKELKASFQDLKIRFANMINSNKPESELEDLIVEFRKLESEMQETGNTGVKFTTLISKRIRGMSASFIAQWLSLYDIIRYIRQSASTIIQLDDALVDLSKTTKMSSSELTEFYYNANRLAKEMGVTTAEIINQASAFSRLGFSSKEASEAMAQLSSKFASISPDMDVSTATDGLVSVMKAFDVEVEDVERKILDNINIVGNTAATSNGEIVDMLMRSSAAMKEANNSLEETIALETAAVEITRNAETTGTAFKTVAMRIRGYDEETEELSDDLKNISGDIADLTKTANNQQGISLFTDESKTEYKSTYQLMKEISEIYDDLTDKQQAGLLEKLAGKRGGQVIGSLLSNFEAAENALANMENAAGSADQEMEKIRNSLSYKTNEFSQTWVGLIQQIFKKEDLASVIGSATEASEALTDTIVELGKALSYILNILSGILSLAGSLIKILGPITPYLAGGIILAKKNIGLFKTELNELNKITFPNIEKLVGLFSKPIDFIKDKKQESITKSAQEYEEALLAIGEATEDIDSVIIEPIEVEPVIENVDNEDINNLIDSFNDIGGELSVPVNIEINSEEIGENIQEVYDLISEETDSISEEAQSWEQLALASDETNAAISSNTAVQQMNTTATEQNVLSAQRLAVAEQQVAMAESVENQATLDSIIADKFKTESVRQQILADIDLLTQGELLTDSKLQEIIANFDLIASENGLTGARKANILAILQQVSALKNLQAQSKIVSYALGGFKALAGMAVLWGISKLVEWIVKLANTQKELTQKIKDTGEELKEYKKEIDSYKTQLESLNKTLQDQKSSYDDLTSARENILSIQDELIEKYGNEASTIDAITRAIHGEADALDDLAEKEYRDSIQNIGEKEWNKKTSVVKKGYISEHTFTDWYDIYDDDFDSYDKDDINSNYGKLYNAALTNNIVDSNGKFRTDWSEFGGLEAQIEAYKSYLQEAESLGLSYAVEGIQLALYEIEKEYENFLKDNEELYKQSIFFDTIKPDKDLYDLYKEYGEAVKEYNSLFYEDPKKAQEYIAGFWNNSIDNSNLKADVLQYFKDMYPALYKEVELWNFKANLELEVFSTDKYKGSNYQDFLQYQLDRTGFKSEKDFENKNTSAYASLEEIVKDYNERYGTNITLQDVIDYMVENGMIRSENDQNNIENAILKIANSENNSDVENLYESEGISNDTQKLQAWQEAINGSYDSLEEFIEAYHNALSIVKRESLFDILSNDSSTENIDKLNSALLSAYESFNKLTSGTSSAKDLLESMMALSKSMKEINSSATVDWSAILADGMITEDDLDALDLEQFYSDKISKIFENVDDSMKGYIKNLATLIAREEKQRLKLEAVNNSIDGVQDGYKTLKDAIKEYNTYGYLTLDTLQAVIGLDYEYINALIDENGNIRLNKEAYKEYLKVQLAKMEAQVDEEYHNELLRISNMGVQVSLEQAGNATDTYVNKMGNVANASTLASQAIAGVVQTLAAEEALLNGNSLEEAYRKASEVSKKLADEAYNDWQTKKKLLKGSYDGIISNLDKSMGAEDSSSSEDYFDFIEIAISRIEREITNLGKVVDATYINWEDRNSSLISEISKVTDEISLQKSAYEAYMKMADSVGLSKEYKELIQNGGLKIENIQNEQLQKQIQNYQTWYEKALACSDAIEDLNGNLADLAQKRFDMVTSQYDQKINEINHFVNMINGQIESVETRNQIVGKSFYRALISEEQDRLKQLESEYSSLANSLADALNSGAIEYGSEQWASMRDKIGEVQEEIQNSENQILEYGQSIKNVVKEIFDYLEGRYSSLIGLIENRNKLTDSIISLIETSGHIISSQYYKAEEEIIQAQLDAKTKELEALQKTVEDGMNDGSIEKYDNNWIEMTQTIEDTLVEITDLNKELIEMDNNIRQLSWDLFDRAEETISNIVDEANFLIDIMNYNKLFDEYGNFNDRGLATQGLHVSNYNTYLKQAQDYAEEIKKINEDIANDPSNTTLLDRRQELLKTQQSAITNAKSEKEAVKDLAEEGYNTLLDKINELISKYEEALDAEKDLYDYEKNIKEQTSNISDLQNQILAYQGDDSEETRTTIQKLGQDLKDAQEQLQETEYQQWRKDQTAMLNNMTNDIQEWINLRLDNIDLLMNNAISVSEDNGLLISSTIESEAANVGYTITNGIDSILNGNITLESVKQTIMDFPKTLEDISTIESNKITSSISSNITNLQNILSNYFNTNGNLSSFFGNNTIQSIIDAINNLKAQVVESGNAIVSMRQSQATSTNVSQNSSSSGSSSSSSSGGSGGSSGSSNGSSSSSTTPSTSQPVKNQVTTYITKSASSQAEIDRYAAELRKQYNTVTINSVKTDSSGRPISVQFRVTKVYAKGTKNAQRGLNLVGEAGRELYIDNYGNVSLIDEPSLINMKGGEQVVKNADTEKILSSKYTSFTLPTNMQNFVSNLNGFSLGTTSIGGIYRNSLPKAGLINSSTTVGDVNINLPNVTNKEEFVAWLKTDGQINKIIQTMTIGQAMGSNKYAYRNK